MSKKWLLALATALAAMVAGQAVAPPVDAGTTAPAAAAPGVETLTAEVDANVGAAGRTPVTVVTEPELGRIELQISHFHPSRRPFVHVGLGVMDGQSCAPAYWVVVDRHDLEVRLRDGQGGSIPVEERFAIPEHPESTRMVRIALPEMTSVDCATGTLADGDEPITSEAAAGLEPRLLRVVDGFALLQDPSDRGMSPATLESPRNVPWGGEFSLELGYEAIPYSSGQVLPSTVGEMTIDVDAGPDTALVSAPPTLIDVDLWRQPTWSTDLVFRADPSRVHSVVAPWLALSWDGARDQPPLPDRLKVAMPPPDDWRGSLAGETWWRTHHHFEIRVATVTHVYEFLDDRWVHVSSGGRAYRQPHTAPCTEAATRAVSGCHRYYFDASSGQLQIDHRRVRYREQAGSWMLPAADPDSNVRTEEFGRERLVLPPSTGMRLAYHGTGRHQDLLLRRDGTYRYRFGRAPETVWRGRYRLVGGDRPMLTLTKHGADFRAPVALYYRVVDGKRSLRNLGAGRIFVQRARS